MPGTWTDDENDKCVAAYLEMLRLELAGKPYVKLHYNQRLQEVIKRSHRSIEFKNNNISAVLGGLGEPWIVGYKPFPHFQLSLVDAVIRGLKSTGWVNASFPKIATSPDSFADNVGLFIDKPPIYSPETITSRELEYIERIAKKWDPAERDKQNRELGYAGEETVFHHERSFLKSIGRDDLARKVRWVSQEDGDGAGYDISSYDREGRTRLLEVKTTKGSEKAPFYLTKNEKEVSDNNKNEWRLLRLWNFPREPKAFELVPPLEDHVRLTANSFRADVV